MRDYIFYWKKLDRSKKKSLVEKLHLRVKYSMGGVIDLHRTLILHTALSCKTCTTENAIKASMS